ncbi:glucose 1-dehydrogenase [Mammaliicoccus sciuri]|uniref:3-oxoacyl-[acyl-carrier-protein] reductase FabG n=1 Tax=Mammaliicoccus sciuri TaxID=1296 RepID=A0AB37HPV4_MAMSC|nr:glucose 1-dehydrogenase [Mammaliicoccus sciuri]MEB6342510.1 glucose 1-dehydrogenase [Mammaliicoccus sciuri]MEB7414363.1 glucose 1-dehydrogenase [Mammaliicoccus sciuri]QRN90634.1 glucose 1-dehydrogenase [Mammaliicoccus sciuri]
MSELNEQVIIVTGAGKGIGKGIAKQLGSKGAKIVVATIDPEFGKETVTEIIDNGGDAYFVETDVSKEESIINMVNETVNHYGKINTLVNNAGITVFKSIEEATVEDWDSIINIDLRGTFLCSKHVIPEMKKQGGGSIINISSNHSIATLPDTDMYAAAKGGVNAMTRGMALSLGKYNIRVNAICPGFTNTSHLKNWFDSMENEDEVRQGVLDLHATSRINEPEDIGKLAQYLASDDSVMMTGEHLVIDGGLSARLYNADGY